MGHLYHDCVSNEWPKAESPRLFSYWCVRAETET